MTMQVELTFKELTQAVYDYARAKGLAMPANAKVLFECRGPDVQTVGGITSIAAKIVLQEQETVAGQTASPNGASPSATVTSPPA